MSWCLDLVSNFNKFSFLTTFQQTKRKLDDVSKRLDMLYDLLREHRVSGLLLRCSLFHLFRICLIIYLSIFIPCLFHVLADAKHIGFFESIGSAGSDW